MVGRRGRKARRRGLTKKTESSNKRLPLLLSLALYDHLEDHVRYLIFRLRAEEISDYERSEFGKDGEEVRKKPATGGTEKEIQKFILQWITVSLRLTREDAR
jgi:hypothetical protein